MMKRESTESGDVQGLARFGFGKLTEACFFLLGIEKRPLAQAWLATAPVTSARHLPEAPDTAMQAALTCEGLRALNVPDEVVQGFSAEFISGMSGEESRSRRLGDLGASAPSRWRWGNHAALPHVLVMLYARKGYFAAWKDSVESSLRDGGFSIQACLPSSDLGGAEPFGFADGISQPGIEWNGGQAASTGDRLDYGNLLSLGELLLGYPNEYGKYTDRPLLTREARWKDKLPPAKDRPDKLDVGRNGTYLVFRQLSQDVRGFWRYLDGKTGSNAEESRRLAESMVGRTISGEPLLALSKRKVPGIGPNPEDERFNRFTYDADPHGARCPLGAHIRRANPRNPDLPGRPAGAIAALIRTLGLGRGCVRDDTIAASRFHRLLRRGREYGPGLSPEEAVRPGPADDPERGLHFICLNANIARQFEFVQNAWIMSTKFAVLSQESDPLLGNRQPLAGCPSNNAFSFHAGNGVRGRLTDVPQFVTVRGGAYFFLPGLRALRFLATAGAD